MAEFTRPDAPPPPLFVGEKERNLVRQVNTELIENVVGQAIAYYAISLDHTNFHPVYGEAIQKTFLPPIRIYARVEVQETEVTNESKGYDARPRISVYFHRKRLTEDQNLLVRTGDFVYYDGDYYEIVKVTGAKRLFGQEAQKYETTAECIKAREGLFDGN